MAEKCLNGLFVKPKKGFIVEPELKDYIGDNLYQPISDAEKREIMLQEMKQQKALEGAISEKRGRVPESMMDQFIYFEKKGA